jgi:hypothetical protein
MKNNPLFGAWKLKSLETRASDGSVSYPWGKKLLVTPSSVPKATSASQ